MNSVATDHPSHEQLQAFAQGRLSLADFAAMEEHVAHCDTCCGRLAEMPDDTLIQLAKDAVTTRFRADLHSPPPESTKPPEMPPELAEHPRYKVLGLVGLGGMGAVYKAEHRLMERLVALKVINRSLLQNAAAVERFRREVRAAAKLSHPNIVTAFDAEQEGELHYLVMEFVDGLSLDRVIAKMGPLQVPQACQLIRQAALGLQHAHERGMVHRDIKPQNLMVTRKGQLKILDFGLARFAAERAPIDSPSGEADADSSTTTKAGMILGTPDYIAPEQVSDARAADIRADIYSLGCTLYFLLAGEPPFAKETILQKLASHAHEAPQPLRARRDDIPVELDAVLAKMLAKNPAERYQTPGELAKDLSALAKGQITAGSKSAKGRSLEELIALPDEPGERLGKVSEPSEATLPPDLQLPPLGDPMTFDPAIANTIAALPPVVKPKTSILPFDNPALVPILLGCGAALALVILSYAIAQQAFPDNGDAQSTASIGSVASSGTSTKATKNESPEAPSPPSGTLPPEPPQSPSILDNQTSIAEDGKKLPRKALLVIPSKGLYFPDYRNVRKALEAKGIKVDLASTTSEPVSEIMGDPNGFAKANIEIGPKIKPTDYGAIVFVGYETDEFSPGGPAGNEIARIIREFNEQGRFITAICRGQRVLAAHGQLDGRTVADSQYAKDVYEEHQVDTGDKAVERDGKLITASTDQDAVEFAAEIDAAIDSRR